MEFLQGGDRMSLALLLSLYIVIPAGRLHDVIAGFPGVQ